MKANHHIKKDDVKPNINNVKDKTATAKKMPVDKTGENCPVNPAQGISYLPPKDENHL